MTSSQRLAAGSLTLAIFFSGASVSHAGISASSVSAGWDLYQLAQPFFPENNGESNGGIIVGPPPNQPIGVFNDIQVIGNPLGDFDFGTGGEDVGSADFIVRRTQDAFGPAATVPVEIVALSLRSVQPIDVGGGVTDFVYFGLDDANPSDGTYDFEFDDSGDEFFAGTYNATFNINYEMRVGAPDGQVVDTGSVTVGSSFGSDPFTRFPTGLSPFNAPDKLIQGVNFLLDGTQDTDFFQSFSPLLLENFDDVGGQGPGDFTFFQLGFENANSDDPGDTPDNPVLPDDQPPEGGFIFNDVPGQGWFDPPATSAYAFETDGNSNFVSVGTPDTFVVPDADGQYVITTIFGSTTVFAGSGITFPTPVTWFVISGIDPEVDGGDPLAFPTFLQFDAASNTFTMTPVPEPAAAVLVICAVGGFAAARRVG